MLKSQTNSQVLSADGEMPIRLVTIHGIPFWQASGRTFPLVAGAEDPPPGDGKNGDDKPPPSGDLKGGTGGDGDDAYDKDRALATIKKLRDGEKTLKAQLKELDDLKAKQKERDDAEKSEAEKLREQLADAETKRTAAEQKLKETETRRSIERAAQKAGANDADDVFALLKASDFDLGDDGDVKNADKLVEALLKSKPYLKGKGDGSPPAHGNSAGPRPAGSPGAEERTKETEQRLVNSGKYPRF